MDALIVDKKKYHKSCFRCEHCRNRLSVGNYVSLHGHFYCLHHYKQLLKTTGNFDNGLGQQSSLGGASAEEWRYSTGSLSSVDKYKSRSYENVATKTSDHSKAQGSKISVVWPPQADHPKKSFRVEDDIQVTKPQWPPPDAAPESPTLQHRKAVPRSVL